MQQYKTAASQQQISSKTAAQTVAKTAAKTPSRATKLL
jgi:hypothetical protein